jgi:uncharacterized membrane protein YGL010W
MNQIAQRSIDRLLSRYAESHRNPVNEVVHCICVPAIVFTVLGLLWALHPVIALLVTVLALAYYFTLSVPMLVGMCVMLGAMLAVLYALPQGRVLPLSIVVFVLAWIGQFIGHHIEGKRPSFFEDLRYLLIGPLFVLGFLYRRFKIAY